MPDVIDDTAIVDLLITQEDDKSYDLAFWQDTAHTETVDITGVTVKMSIKRSLADADLVIPAIVVTDHTDAENGKTTISLSSDETNLARGNYYYDIQISGGSLPKKTVMKGKLTITWQVTDDESESS